MRNKSYTDPLQLTLPIEFAPSVVRVHGLDRRASAPAGVLRQRLRARVLLSHVPPEGMALRRGRVRERGQQLRRRSRSTATMPTLTLAGFSIRKFQPPNWRVFRPDNGHSHAVWTLAVPVHKYPKARRGPLDYLSAIAEIINVLIDALIKRADYRLQRRANSQS